MKRWVLYPAVAVLMLASEPVMGADPPRADGVARQATLLAQAIEWAATLVSDPPAAVPPGTRH